jgi:hypothetical protein
MRAGESHRQVEVPEVASGGHIAAAATGQQVTGERKSERNHGSYFAGRDERIRV